MDEFPAGFLKDECPFTPLGSPVEKSDEFIGKMFFFPKRVYNCYVKNPFFKKARHRLTNILEKGKNTLKGENVFVVFMDPAKASDTIDHDLLVIKLQTYGFFIQALKLICSLKTYDKLFQSTTVLAD